MAGGALIVAGFGFRGAATVESLADALARAKGDLLVAALSTATDKAASSVFRDFVQDTGLPVRAIDPEALALQETATRSAASQASRGTGSLAEAAALAAAGPGARLMGPRSISGDGMATCALAEGTEA